jgi:hypothetical protein
MLDTLKPHRSTSSAQTCTSTLLACTLPGTYSLVLLRHTRARLVSAREAHRSTNGRIHGSDGHAPRLLGRCRRLGRSVLASLQLLLHPPRELERLGVHLLELGHGES